MLRENLRFLVKLAKHDSSNSHYALDLKKHETKLKVNIKK